MTMETPFRLMWTDEEGDNICFSRLSLRHLKSNKNKPKLVPVSTNHVQKIIPSQTLEHLLELQQILENK